MKTWRAKQYRLKIGHRTLVVTLRRFRTKPSNRSKLFRQLVLPVPVASIKEVALRLVTSKRRRRQSLSGRSRRLLRQTAPYYISVLGIAGSLFFGQQVTEAHSIAAPKTFNIPAVSVVEKPAAPVIKPLPASVPINISIPAVNIDYPIMPVGQAADGSIQMPPILEWITGWYKYSPTPGQIGPAVIVGHVDNYENISVFWRLRYVVPGDDIYITRADGSIAHFKVTSLQQVAQDNFPTQAIYGNISYPGLRLITCGGTFSTATESYNQNTVVFASLVE